jgi:hypothetical protein
MPSFGTASAPQILRILDRIPLQGKRVLEISLGEGANSEQLIRRGAVNSGLDLTEESIWRVGRRFSLHGCPYVDLKQGRALDIP